MSVFRCHSQEENQRHLTLCGNHSGTGPRVVVLNNKKQALNILILIQCKILRCLRAKTQESMNRDVV